MSDAGFLLFVVAMLGQIGWAYWVQRLSMKNSELEQKMDRKDRAVEELSNLIDNRGKFMDRNGKADWNQYDTDDVAENWNKYNKITTEYWRS